jgi:flavin-dependent dehydrogenase
LDYDVIVVGARVAGSMLATLLGENGARVLLLDRNHFPSDTLSTHFFRSPSFQAFRRIGVFEAIQSLAPHLEINFNDVDGHVFREPVEGPKGLAYHLCIRRIVLDEVLVRRAQEAKGVELRQGARLDELLWEDKRVVGARWTEAGQERQATARAVVGADGIHSRVAALADARMQHSEPIHRAMYYAYFQGVEGVPGPAAEFHYRGNRLVYVFPADSGLTLVAASVPISDFEVFRKDAEARFTQEIVSTGNLGDRLRGAERVGPVRGSGNIPGYQRVPFDNGWALVGDAGQVMDPWSGQGIDQASTHAGFLADALADWLDGRETWDGALGAYHRKRDEFSSKAYHRTCKYAEDFRPMTQAALQRRGLLAQASSADPAPSSPAFEGPSRP